MYEAFKGTKKLLSRKPKVQSPRPDNFVFRLHYQFTFGFLAIAVLLVTGYSYIDTNGSAIQCMMDKGIGVPAPVINSFCWIMSTYSLPKYYNGDQGTDFIHHGVGPQGEDDEEVYHAYYQWVPLFLSFQAVMFYLPHYIWKVIEGGRFRRIVAGLNSVMEYSNQEIDLNNLATYMNTRLSHGNKGEHISWAIKFYLCEVLNFINVVVQIVITDRFLGGSFYNYGIEAASWSDIEEEDRVDPMYKVFPRMTKCMFHKYGGSGTLQKFDALCVLGMNIINEKIFVFLWFWYVFLATVTAINLIMRISQFMSSSMRFNLVKFEEFGIKEKQIKHDVLENVLSKLSYSDWLLLYYLAQCMNKGNFSKLLHLMGDNLSHMVDSKMDEVDSSSIDKTNFDRDATLKSPSKLRNFLKYT